MTQKEKNYFGFLSKDELFKFFERLKMALALGKKIGDKKTFELEIKGCDHEITNGFSLDIFTFDKNKYSKFFEINKDYMKKTLYIFTLNLKAKGEDYIKEIKDSFEMTIKPLITGFSEIKGRCEMHFRNNGKNVSFDLIIIDGEIMKSIIDVGINLSQYHEFYLSLKSAINIYELFPENIDGKKILGIILSLLFTIKSSGENVKYLIEAISNALNDVKLHDIKMQKKFNEMVKFLNFIYAYIGTKIKLNYDGKLIAEQLNIETERHLTDLFKYINQVCKELLKTFVRPILEGMGLMRLTDSILCDEISLCFGIPKYYNGLALIINIPGLNDLVRINYINFKNNLLNYYIIEYYSNYSFRKTNIIFYIIFSFLLNVNINLY